MTVAARSTGNRSFPRAADPARPSPARLYDYYLGGTDWLPVDRIAAEKIRDKVPELEDVAWASRGFLQRATRWIALRTGVGQFIDIGAGFPTRNTTHQAAQTVAAESRVAYVDKDAMVVGRGRALLAGVPHTAFIGGDLREPDRILADPELRSLIDFNEPVGLVLGAVLHFVSDEWQPERLVRHYLDALAPGSYLALSHCTSDRVSPAAAERMREVYSGATEQIHFRTRREVERFFVGLETVPPFDGAPAQLTYTGLWGADCPESADSDGSRWGYCAVARKP